MTIAAYDSDKHHVGLGVDSDTLKGLVLVGPYLRGNAAPVFDKPSDIGTDDLTGARSMSRWTQNDYSGGEFQEDWGDVGMFSECLSMLPNQLSRSIRTTLPLKLARGNDFGAGIDLIRMDTVDGFIYACVNTEDPSPNVVRLNPSSPSGAGMETELADCCSGSSLINAAAWNLSSSRLWIGSTVGDLAINEWVQANVAGSRLVVTNTLGTPGADLTDPTVSITGIHIFGTMKFVVTGHGGGSDDNNRVWLYESGTGADTKWAPVGILPGAYVTSVTYNNAVYILTRSGDSRTQLSMTQGDQVFPVLDLPYFFHGQSMVEYAGRLYIGGVGLDLEGNVHHGELFEVNGTSLRLVRTFAPEYVRPDPAAQFDGPRIRTMRHFKALQVAEGLLWMPDSSDTGLEVYDATTDSFYGGPRLRTGDDANLEFTHIISFGDSLYLWGVTSSATTTGWYRNEKVSDAGGAYTATLVTSDFHPEPASEKVWGQFATFSRNFAPALEVSVDGGSTWTSVTPESTTSQGIRRERHWSLEGIAQSRSIRFKLTFSLLGVDDEPAAELVSHSLSFLVKGDPKRRWTFQVNAANKAQARLQAVGGPGPVLVEQIPADVSGLLWGFLDGSDNLVLRDVDGTDYAVVVTDVQEQLAKITPDCESFISVTVLEV